MTEPVLVLLLLVAAAALALVGGLRGARQLQRDGRAAAVSTRTVAPAVAWWTLALLCALASAVLRLTFG